MTELQAKPLVSVILPVYNVAPFLDECLESVYAQTLAGVEIIAVDDGSTDGSLELLRQHAVAGRLTLLEQPNSGAGIARNRGMEVASGAYLFFLDSDDKLPHSAVLEILAKIAEKESADLCGGNVISLSETGERSIYKGCETFDGEEVDCLTGYCDIFGFSRFLYRRAFLKQHGLFFPRYRRFEDPVFLVRVLLCSPVIVRSNEEVYLYRDSGTTDWSDFRKIVDVLNGLCETLRLTGRVGCNASMHQKAYSQLVALTRRVVAPALIESAVPHRKLVFEALETTLAEVEPKLLFLDVPTNANQWLGAHSQGRRINFGPCEYSEENVLNGRHYTFRVFGRRIISYKRTVRYYQLGFFGRTVFEVKRNNKRHK